jgi:hypothetical protein
MRVGYLRVAGSRVGIAGHDPVRARLAQPLPVQPNVERPEVDALQHDGVGGDGKLVPLEVDV